MKIPIIALSRRRRAFLLMIVFTLLSLVFVGLFRAVDHEDVEPSDSQLDQKKYQADGLANLLGDNRRQEETTWTSELEEGTRTVDIMSEHEDNYDISQTDGDAEEPVATTGVNMADHGQHSFDAEKVFKLFCSCRGEDNAIIIDCYVDAYEELCKLFRVFGTIFSFVTSDVEEKIGILRDYRKAENADHYQTIQSMIDYEVANDLTKHKKKPSGSRTLLRLHRALEFISAFLLKLKESDNKDKFSTHAGKAYDTTLAKHHPWLIKKAVHVALYMLPTRPDLLNKMGVPDNEKGMQGITDLVTELNTIFEITEEVYAKNNLLDLP